MRLDDRFMTILTALVLIIAIGALFQGKNGEGSIFGAPTTYQPKPDTYAVRAGRTLMLDVLLNDANSDKIDVTALSVVSQPTCGQAVVIDGAIQYTAAASCAGDIELTYCIANADSCELTPVTLKVLQVAPTEADQQDEPVAMAAAEPEVTKRASNDTDNLLSADDDVPEPVEAPTATAAAAPEPEAKPVEVAAATPAAKPVEEEKPVETASAAPAVFDDVIQGSSPQSLPRISMQPARLQAPSKAEVITPAEAAENIRNRGSAGAQGNVIIADATDSGVTVSQTSARTGTVSSSGFEMKVPQITEESSGVQIASVATTAPSRNTSPIRIGVAAQSDRINPILETAPAAQEDAPTQIAALVPDTTDVLNQIASSRSFIGVTFTAAKSLLSPSKSSVQTPMQDAVLSTAPRPSDDILGPSRFELASLIEPSVGIDLNLPSDSDDATPANRQVAPIQMASLTDQTFVRLTEPAAPPAKPEPVVTEEPATETPTEQPETREPHLVGHFGSNAPAFPTVKPKAAVEDQLQVAALPSDTAPEVVPDVVETAPAPVTSAAQCDAEFTVTALPGAELEANLNVPCKPNEMFTVVHETLAFSAMTDAAGTASFIVPAFAADAQVSVLFATGRPISASTSVSGMSRITRVAIVWEAPVDLNLRAREFGAQPGSEGDIWQENQLDYRAARRTGGGYHTYLGLDPLTSGSKAEVYTLLRGGRTPEGFIEMSLEVASFGEMCGKDMIVSTIRSAGAQIELERDVQILLGDCGSTETMTIREAVQDIRVARN